MKSGYDVIVVGGGPAGSTAARHAASRGAEVAILEKDREIGIPVRCAEGVAHKSLAQEVEIQPHWIAQKITGVRLHAPSGAEVPIYNDQVGYILHRKLFDYDLAKMAAAAGVSVFTKTYVNGLIMESGRVGGVAVEHLGERQRISAKIVIAADGVESRVGRWAGLDTKCAMNDMETCAQVTIGNYEQDPEIVHFFFGHEAAPAGYAWIFPKGEGMANIGLGISGDVARLRSPHDCLQDFLDRFFPKAAILSRVYGGVPCSTALKEIVAEGLMLTGDAAHQVNPLTGGGICSGMVAGRLAGQTAAAAIAEGRCDRERLRTYSKAWQEEEGSRQAHYYRLRKFVFGLDDKDYNSLAKSVLDLPEEKRTMMNIFKAALINKPSLILDAIKLFT
jgi:digeranylgeranylglycerophospholipid reductase